MLKEQAQIRYSRHWLVTVEMNAKNASELMELRRKVEALETEQAFDSWCIEADVTPNEVLAPDLVLRSVDVSTLDLEFLDFITPPDAQSSEPETQAGSTAKIIEFKPTQAVGDVHEYNH